MDSHPIATAEQHEHELQEIEHSFELPTEVKTLLVALAALVAWLMRRQPGKLYRRYKNGKGE